MSTFGAGDYFTAAAFDLLKHRAELENLNSRLSRKEAERDQLVGYQRQLQSALQSTQTRALNQQEFQMASHIWGLIQLAQERLEALYREIDTDIDTRLQRHFDLVRLSAQHSTELQRLLVAVNVCVRREISDPLNEAEYRHLIDASTKAQEESFHALLREFKERAESVDEPEPNQAASPGSIERRSE